MDHKDGVALKLDADDFKWHPLWIWAEEDHKLFFSPFRWIDRTGALLNNVLRPLV